MKSFPRPLHSLLLIVASSFPFSLPAADWPSYRGPNHNGTSTEKVVPWKGENLKQLWKAETPNGFSSFAVAGGRAVTQISREIEGVPTELCLALDAKTGKELWTAPVGIAKYDHDGGNSGAPSNRGGDGPRSTPTLHGDKVYVLSSQLVLHCLEGASGKTVWKKDLVREHAGRNITWKNAASPVIDGHLVFVAGGGEGQSLLAFDKNSGNVVWKTGNETMTHSTPVLADIHGQRQIIFFTQSGLVSLETSKGSLLWKFPFPYKTSTAMTPVVAGDTIYCSAGYGVGAGACKITRQGEDWKAEELWRKPNQLPNHWSTPVHHGGYLYGMFSFKEYGEGPLKCVELATGREVWSKPGFGAGNCIWVDGKILALADDGQVALVAASPEKYEELARTKAVEGKCWSTPVLSNHRIYVRSTKEAVCLEIPSRISQN